MTITPSRNFAQEEELIGTAVTVAGSDRGSPTLIPASRYHDPEWYGREIRDMWPRTWHIACSVDHVAEPGDYFEYLVGPYSVLIVRGNDGVLRAYQNACRHRGNVLCQGTGGGLKEIRCVYHNWAWDLNGRLREVPSRKGFGVLRNDDFPLVPAQVDTWGPLVFVNMDMGAMPLAEYLDEAPADSAWADLDEFQCTYTLTIPTETNWKIISDGFSETYHVQGIHAVMLGCIDDINSWQRIWNHVGVSYQPYGVASPRLGRSVPDQVVWESYITTQGGRMGVEEVCPHPPVPEGQTIRDVIAEHIRQKQAARGVDLSRFDTEQLTGLSQYNVFPNATVLVSGDLLSVLLSRPVGPERGEFVSLHLERRPKGQAARVRPTDVRIPIEEANLGLVLGADLKLLLRAQTGVRQPGLTHIAVSSEECRLINTHRNLERYLGVTPSEMSGGPVR